MSVEAFRLCPTPGCIVNVWGPALGESYCRAHGGNRLGFPEVAEADEWGEPTTNQAASGGTPPPVAGPPLPEV